MHKELVRYFYYPFLQKLKRGRVIEYIKSLEESQWFERERLKEMQWDKLRRLLNVASENIPYYRNLFKDNKIKIENIKNYEDFLNIPVLTKEDVRNNFSQLINPNYSGKFYRGMTSGSTGLSLELLHSVEFASWVYAGQWRARRWFGVDIGDRALYIWGRPLDSLWGEYVGKLKARLKNVMLIPAFELSEETLEKQWGRIKRFRPHYIYGYASSVYKLAEYIERSGQDSQLQCKGVFTTAETLFAHQREIIESVFSCKVGQEYGCAEVGAFAYECLQENLHIYLENVFVEVLRDNKPVLPGEAGEIVVTCLTNYCMPLIRYRLGDMGVFLDKQCPCKRELPLMDVKIAKITDMVVTPEGKVFSSELFNYINL